MTRRRSRPWPSGVVDLWRRRVRSWCRPAAPPASLGTCRSSGAPEHGLRIAGLCDAGEERFVRGGLQRAGLGTDLTRELTRDLTRELTRRPDGAHRLLRLRGRPRGRADPRPRNGGGRARHRGRGRSREAADLPEPARPARPPIEPAAAPVHGNPQRSKGALRTRSRREHGPGAGATTPRAPAGPHLRPAAWRHCEGRRHRRGRRGARCLGVGATGRRQRQPRHTVRPAVSRRRGRPEHTGSSRSTPSPGSRSGPASCPRRSSSGQACAGTPSSRTCPAGSRSCRSSSRRRCLRTSWSSTPRRRATGSVSLGIEVNVLPAAVEAGATPRRARGGPAQPADAVDVRRRGGLPDDIDAGVEVDVPLVAHPAARPDQTSERDRPARRRAGAGRRDRAGGHRRRAGRGPGRAHRAPRTAGVDRDVQRRRDAPRSSGRPRPLGAGDGVVRVRVAGALRLGGRQRARDHAAHRAHQLARL